ncbi:pirin family protein [Pseudoxanthomonas putridarboris]|uniref:Pirin-like C-terminal cupin domain-containing protein n=1 Tax=Pseudoxanthomonas putridarboris TaxID=752605 RepID=A0ABU9J6Q4_9GAMM
MNAVSNTGTSAVAGTALPERPIARKTRAGAPAPGFAGPGHTAMEVVRPDALARTDPFVLLMDDTLDFAPGQPVGEAHPHAGLETVTLVLEGSLDDADEGLLQTGDLAWMTAGRGLVHNEHVKATGHARILQLWVALPRSKRDGDPDLQVVPLETLPLRSEPGVQARLYSGSTGTLTSPTRNRVPMTIVDFLLAPGASTTQALPGAYTGFLYVIDGSLRAGHETLSSGDIGWLERVPHDATRLGLEAGSSGARVVLYAGRPLDEPIMQHGPFVAGSREELAAYYRAYSAGTFRRISELGRDGSRETYASPYSARR